MTNISKSQVTDFQTRVLKWYDAYGRKDLPWHLNRDTYRVWVSEIMLQQTQVSTVIDYFNNFMARFPTLHSLATADTDDVLAHWSGLGYYARARNLHKAAQQVVEVHKGEFPVGVEGLTTLPGIGRSTAGAIASVTQGMRAPILDGNVKRVLTRCFAVEGHPSKAAVDKVLWKLADQLTPTKRVAEYTQVIMDLGATVCTRSKPKCNECPIQSHCIAYAQGEPTRYPTPKAKGPKKETRHKNFFVVTTSTGELLLERRHSSGIWGGLWCFPEAEVDQTDLVINPLSIHIDESNFSALEEKRHTFSHYHLMMSIYIHKLDSTPTTIGEANYGWYNAHEAMTLGLPKPIADTIQHHFMLTNEGPKK